MTGCNKKAIHIGLKNKFQNWNAAEYLFFKRYFLFRFRLPSYVYNEIISCVYVYLKELKNVKICLFWNINLIPGRPKYYYLNQVDVEFVMSLNFF